MHKAISHCRICGNPNLESTLNLGMQALTGVFPRLGDSVERGPLELVKCIENGPHTCGLVQLRNSFEPEQMYGENYGYRSGLNRSMVEHLHGIARAAKSRVQLSPGDVVLDIGSNDSTLLQALYEPGVIALGMDPSGLKFRSFYPSHIDLIPEFFSAAGFARNMGDKKARIVSSIAMFYDLEAPIEFMKQIREILAEDGIWIFEQSYLPTMVEKNSYDTVCHEHLEYYRLKQIVWMAERVGFEILDVELNAANGGSFRVLAARSNAKTHALNQEVSAMLQREEAQGFGGREVFDRFAERVRQHRDALRSFLNEARTNNKNVIGLGASTKGNVVLQYCGLTTSHLSCIAEVNPEKFGHLTPGTGIPIISEDDALALRPDAFLVLPWHFRDSFLLRSDRYLSGGRAFIFPLPEIEVYRSGEGSNSRL